MKQAIILLLLVFCVKISAQGDFDIINSNNIKYGKVIEYLDYQKNININSIDKLQASFNDSSNENDYFKDVKTFLIKEKLSDVWYNYITTNPATAWNGHKVKFGLLLNKNDKTPYYYFDTLPGISLHQVIYLNLKLLSGIYNRAMAFEIINIDPIKKVVEFSYLKGNLSEGKQVLKFIETKEGYTEIIHTSFFITNSKVMNKHLYPFFHTRVIKDFHKNMKKRIYAIN